VVNDGPEKILYLSLTVEFADSMNQIALRETRAVLGVPQRRWRGRTPSFWISFDHVPSVMEHAALTCALSYLLLHSKIDIR